jgi:hypothetical protein
LYFLPLPQGQGVLGEIFSMGVAFLFCTSGFSGEEVGFRHQGVSESDIQHHKSFLRTAERKIFFAQRISPLMQNRYNHPIFSIPEGGVECLIDFSI